MGCSQIIKIGTTFKSFIACLYITILFVILVTKHKQNIEPILNWFSICKFPVRHPFWRLITFLRLLRFRPSNTGQFMNQHTHTHTHTHIRTYVCMYVCMYVCVCIYIYTHTHFTYSVCVCVCVYIYIYGK